MRTKDMHEKDIESGRMIFARSSRLRGLFYFVALGMMVGLLTTVQLRGIRNGPSRGIDDGLTVPPASSVNPIGSRNGTVESEEEKNEQPVTLEELQDEVEELLEQVEEDNDQHRESEENLKKIIEQEDPEEGTEAGDEETDEIPLVEKFKQATKIFAELKPSLEPNITMKLTAFEMQSILGDCDSNTVSGDLFKSELEQRMEEIEIEAGSELEQIWCSLKGNQHRDVMKVFIMRINALNAQRTTDAEIAKMENDYDAFLETRESDDFTEENSSKDGSGA